MAKYKVKIIPLGGLGEIGKNMMLIETPDDIVIIDVGVMFPDEEMFGIDLVIPDISYLLDKLDKVRGIVITHGHEDHTGALPYVLPRVNVPIYATQLTLGLISVKLREHKLLDQTTLVLKQPGEEFQLGDLTIEFFHVAHSIPDSCGAVIRTPIGNIVHSGDFKFDHTPVDGRPTDASRIAQLGAEGVLCLLSDSTRVENPGYTPSERIIGDTFDSVFSQAEGRIIVATFASLISRVQQVLDMCERWGRHCAVAGRSMVNNVNMALELGFLHTAPGIIVRPDEATKLPPDQVCFITTGSQGEPTSVITRIANKDHPLIRVQPGDTFVISSSPIPGNDVAVARNIDNLSRQGAVVLYNRISNVHVSGHAGQEELKLLINLIRPEYFIPIHGEYRFLMQHAKLARAMGLPPENAIVAEDGDVIEFTADEPARIAGRVSSGNVFVDGLSVGDIGQVVLRDRQMLAQDGILMVVVTIDKQTGGVIAGPDIVSRGFVYMRDAEELMDNAKAQVLGALRHTGSVPEDWAFAKTKICDTLSQYLYEQTKRSPMIIPVVMEV